MRYSWGADPSAFLSSRCRRSSLFSNPLDKTLYLLLEFWFDLVFATKNTADCVDHIEDPDGSFVGFGIRSWGRISPIYQRVFETLLNNCVGAVFLSKRLSNSALTNRLSSSPRAWCNPDYDPEYASHDGVFPTRTSDQNNRKGRSEIRLTHQSAQSSRMRVKRQSRTARLCSLLSGSQGGHSLTRPEETCGPRW